MAPIPRTRRQDLERTADLAIRTTARELRLSEHATDELVNIATMLAFDAYRRALEDQVNG